MMQIIFGSELDAHTIEKSVVTVGNFDGVHRGHGELFRRLKHRAIALGVPSVVLTFEPHPLQILAPDKAPLLITTLDQKLSLIDEYGVDVSVVIPFSREFSRIPADVFVRNTLCGSLGMCHIIIGHDYAFGRGRQGNYRTLEALGQAAGFTLEDLEPVGNKDTVFSSSEVRRAIMAGELDTAAMVLGRYHLVSGIVVHGEHRGSGLGYPTANIRTDNLLLPPDGVYAVWVTVDGKHLHGACNVGKNLTFGATERTIEVFILDSNYSLYGSKIAIHFVRRLREVQKFTDVVTLQAAIKHDVEETRAILSASDQKLIHPGYSTRQQE